MEKPNPIFKAVDVHFSDRGLVFVCPDAAEAQRAYCEGQLKGCAIAIEGNKIILLRSSQERGGDAPPPHGD